MLSHFQKVLHPDLIIDLPDPKVSMPVDNQKIQAHLKIPIGVIWLKHSCWKFNVVVFTEERMEVMNARLMNVLDSSHD